MYCSQEKLVGKTEFDAIRSMPEEGQAETKTANPYSKAYLTQNPLQGGSSHES